MFTILWGPERKYEFTNRYRPEGITGNNIHEAIALIHRFIEDDPHQRYGPEPGSAFGIGVWRYELGLFQVAMLALPDAKAKRSPRDGPYPPGTVF